MSLLLGLKIYKVFLDFQYVFVLLEITVASALVFFCKNFGNIFFYFYLCLFHLTLKQLIGFVVYCEATSTGSGHHYFQIWLLITRHNLLLQHKKLVRFSSNRFKRNIRPAIIFSLPDKLPIFQTTVVPSLSMEYYSLKSQLLPRLWVTKSFVDLRPQQLSWMAAIKERLTAKEDDLSSFYFSKKCLTFRNLSAIAIKELCLVLTSSYKHNSFPNSDST